MTLKPWARPALLLVDLQNDFVRAGAPLEVPDARETLGHNQRLLAWFRQAKLPVVYLRYVAGPHHDLIPWAAKFEWAAQLKAPVWACRRGHRRYYADVGRELECIEVVDEIAPLPGEHVIDKYGYGGFSRTSLHDVLRSHRVESVIITGTVTQVCVEDTARQAFDHGYRTTIVSDAVSSRSPERHRITLDTFESHYGWVLTTDRMLEALAER
jgi:nicotinamidase-related amidase